MKLKKFERRELENKARHYENEIKKIRTKLELDDNTYVIAKGTKTFNQSLFLDYCNMEHLEKTKMQQNRELIVEHMVKGNEIICTLTDVKHDIKAVGVAKLAKGERFRQTFGMSIAENRALQDYIEKQTMKIIEYLD